MKDASALVTVAMLSTFLEERHNDYLDLISPFVLSLLPQGKGDLINKDAIIRGLRDVYGFEEFPIHVLIKIFNKSAKTSRAYINKRGSEYYIEKPFDSGSFVMAQKQIKKAQDEVFDSLCMHLNEKTKYRGKSRENARDMFISFLEQNGLAFVSGIEQLKLLTAKEYDMFHVAQFVLSEYEKRSEIFSQMEYVVRGFFVYKSIYYFGNSQKIELNSKLKKTVIYIDTRLIIEALGFNTTEGKRAARELISLIQESGGVVRTFSHLRDEVANILTKYAKDPYSRPTMRMEYFDINAYSEVDIYRHRNKLDESLKTLGIAIDEPVQIDRLSDKDSEHLELDRLSLTLRDSLGTWGNVNRIENDITSIVSVYSIRMGYHYYSIENCKAILVTTNPGFTQTVNNFFKAKCSGEIGYIIDDVDITALLWLRTWDKLSSLPKNILIENAYAACQPSSELLHSFSRNIEKIKKEDKITAEEALLLRTQMAPREMLLHETQNDPSMVNDGLILKIRDKYALSLTEDQNSEIAGLGAELEFEKRKKYRAVNEAEDYSRRESKSKAKILKGVFLTIFSFIMIIGITALWISYNQTNINLVWKIALVFIGAFGLFDVLSCRIGWIRTILTKYETRKFDTIYQKEIEKVLHYFQ